MMFTLMSATTALLKTNFLFPTLNLTSTIDKKDHAEGFKKTCVFFFGKFTRVFFLGRICHHLGFFGAILGHVGTTFVGCEVHVGPVLVVLSFCCSVFCLSTVFHTAFC